MTTPSQEQRARDSLIDMLGVSRETLDRLGAFHNALQRWTASINLIARNDVDRIWSRHILDSLGLAPLLLRERRGPDPLWLDLGSGGGFPVLPLAIVSRETAPEWRFEAVESDQRKAAFLREIAGRLSVPVTVVASRIEATPARGASVMSARALAALRKLLELTEQQRRDPTTLALLKGERVFDELTEASLEWHTHYKIERHPLTRNGYIVSIEEAYRAENS